MLHSVVPIDDFCAREIRHSLYLPAPSAKHPAAIETYFLDVLDQVDPDVSRPVIVILPGGAYQRLSAREAEPVAIQMNARGLHACVLRYSVSPAIYPTALIELAQTVSSLRRNAEALHIDPHRIVLCGFSAGGHLACSLGETWRESWLVERCGRAAEEMRPDGLVLGYPVIDAGCYAHAQSLEMLTGGDRKLRAQLSLQDHVGPDMPPTFLFHTLEDQDVPVENSLMLAESLRKADVSFELHIFPYGPHGLSLATEDTARIATDGQVQPLMQCWPELAGAWLRTL